MSAISRLISSAREEDVMLIKSPVGMPGRAIRNSFAERDYGRGKASAKALPWLHQGL